MTQISYFGMKRFVPTALIQDHRDHCRSELAETMPSTGVREAGLGASLWYWLFFIFVPMTLAFSHPDQAERDTSIFKLHTEYSVQRTCVW